MFRRTILAALILVATLCFGWADVDARELGNGSGKGDFHENVFEPFPGAAQTQVEPTKPPVKPPSTTTEPTKPPVKPPTTPTEPIKPPTTPTEPIKPPTTIQPPLQPTVSETFNANDTWLVQWYLCGTDLESTDRSDGAASRDLKEMLKVKLPPNVKVLIQTGGTNQWKNSAFQISNNAVERFLYTSNGIEKIQTLSDANMGDPNTLADFLSYGAKNYPADHRVLIFWDHGATNVGGVCKDERYKDLLTLNDLDEGFTKVYGNSPQSKPFELIAFDTCLTSTYEYANAIHKFARYMVASEASAPNCGLNYTGWLGALAQNPALNGRDLGVKICDTFMEGVQASDARSFIDRHEAWESTMSVIDLNAVPALGKAYEDFGREALTHTKQNAKSFYTFFGRAAMSNNTERYNTYDAQNGSVDVVNHVDLLTFAQEIKRQNILTNTPDALTQAVRNAVVYNDARGRYFRKGGGIAVFHPYNSSGVLNYTKQKPAPAPQKQFYGELYNLHRDVVQNLSHEEEQNIKPNATDDQRLEIVKPQPNDNTNQQQEGLLSRIPEDLTPEEIEMFKKDFESLFESLRARGLLAKDQTFEGLTPAEREKIASQMTPEEQAQLYNIYMKIMEKARENFKVDIKKDGTFTAQVAPEKLQYITNVRFMIAQSVEKGKPNIGVDGTAAVFLGSSPDIHVDWAENKFTGTFPNKWPTLNGVPVYIQVTAENAEYDANKNIVGGYNLYIVPIKLNGKSCSLEVAYDYTDKRYYILKVTEGVEADGTMSRSSIEINKGDVITPVLPGIFLKDDNGQISAEFKTIDSKKSITVNNRLMLEDTPFKDGQYAFAFQFTDTQGTVFISKSFSVELDDGEIYSDITNNEFTPEVSVNEQGNITFELPEEIQEEIKEALE